MIRLFAAGSTIGRLCVNLFKFNQAKQTWILLFSEKYFLLRDINSDDGYKNPLLGTIKSFHFELLLNLT